MSAAVTAIPVDTVEPAKEPVARITARKMFKYSEYVDAGEGAIECEHSRDGQCTDTEHFHAWCRLPNPYQHSDVRLKGMAAKARRIRALKDPDSDESVVLAQSLEEFNDPAFTGDVIDELVARDWAENYFEAMHNLAETEEYEHIEQDREEFARLQPIEEDLPEEERSDEFKRLIVHMQTYSEAMKVELARLQQPQRDELANRSFDALMALARTRRVEDDANRAFVDTYNAWMWFVGTFQVERHPTTGYPHIPMWAEIGHRDRPAAGTMFGEAPEVIDAVAGTFNDLQVSLQRGSAGN